jgi:hypothetical protein
MNRSKPPRCDAHFNIVAPRVLVDAVQRVAARNWQSANAYARAALLNSVSGLVGTRENRLRRLGFG